MIRTALVVAVAAWSFSAVAVAAADYSTWEAATRLRCPARHLEFTCDGCWDDYLDDFERTLPKTTQQKILSIADYGHRCKDEIAGLGCEMSVHVDAMSRLGILHRFVAWGCTHYRCEEQALCTRTRPRGGAKGHRG